MSIFIFGKVAEPSVVPGGVTTEVSPQGEGALNWTGSWYFAKNKVNNTSFSYTKCGGEVEKELVDYVSFVNEPQADRPAVGRKGRKGKWQRGRPRSSSVASTSSDVVPSEGIEEVKGEELQQEQEKEKEEAVTVQGQQVEQTQTQGETDLTEEKSEGSGLSETVNEEAVSGSLLPSSDLGSSEEEGGDTTTVAPTTSTEGEEPSKDDKELDPVATDNKEEADVAVSNGVMVKMESSSTHDIAAVDKSSSAPPSSSPSSASAPTLIRIPPRHPLFGVWEGWFSLPAKSSNVGTRGERREEERIEETFFFYAFEGDYQLLQREREREELADEAKIEDLAIPGLEELPHPPRWTAAYIRELHAPEGPDPTRGPPPKGPGRGRGRGRGRGAGLSRPVTPSSAPISINPAMSNALSSSSVVSAASSTDMEVDENNEGQDEERIASLVYASSWEDGRESPTMPELSITTKTMKKEVSFDSVLVTEEGEGCMEGSMEGSMEVQGAGDTQVVEERRTPAPQGEASVIERREDAESSSLDVAAMNVTQNSQTATMDDTVTDSAKQDDQSASSLPEKTADISQPPPTSTAPGSATDVASTPIPPRFSQQQVTPNSSLLIPPVEEVMLVGFGRNQYGRFSLAGAYNPSTGTLRCERKYMLTKYVTPIRQNRLSAGASNSGGDAGTGKRPVRAKRSYSIDTVHDKQDASTALPSTTPSGKRKRSASLWLLQDSSGDVDVAGLEATPLDDSAHQTTAPSSTTSKRGRKKSGQGMSTPVMTSSHFLSAMEAMAEKDGYRRAFLDPSTGDVYEGEWSNGQRNGFGVALFPDGTMYEGWWLNNKEHGAAGLWMTGSREVLYSGEWVEGRLHGSGTYYFPSGDVYVGEFKEGARHGKGRYTKADGSSYDGDWKDNFRHGRGVFTWTDGSEYNGDWEYGQRSGRGELLLSNNLSYSGSWACNFMEGRGELIFPDGQDYKGIFKNGLREGRGSIVFPEGATYEGRFREDVLDGQGTLKISQTVPGGAEDEVFVPLDNLADIRRIHLKSGFGGDAH